MKLQDLHSCKPLDFRIGYSDVDIGVILLQEVIDETWSVVYVSKKLLDIEMNYVYSDIEKKWKGRSWEIWYLCDKEFVSERCIQTIPGRDNVGADYLSRLGDE